MPERIGDMTVYEKQVKDFGDSISALLQVEVDEDVMRMFDEQGVLDYIHSWFQRSCYCEHDCCGHWFGSGYVERKIGLRTYIVDSHYSMNV